MWSKEINYQPKLQFYKRIKTTFSYEPYLNITTDKRKHISRFRSSAHRLHVETARYAKSASNKGSDYQHEKIFNKRCRYCTGKDDIVSLLVELPLTEIIIEDELHVLRCCSKYEHIRAKLSNNVKTMLFNEDFIEGIFHQNHCIETTNFITNICQLRFPKKT